MKHPDFVIWLLGYPLMIAIVEAIHYRWSQKKKPSDTAEGITTLINIVIYFVIAVLLW